MKKLLKLVLALTISAGCLTLAPKTVQAADVFGTIDRSGWSATAIDSTGADVEYKGFTWDDGGTGLMFDDSDITKFHTGNGYDEENNPNYGYAKLPLYFKIDLGKVTSFESFAITNVNGVRNDEVRTYELYVNQTETELPNDSTEGWTKVAGNDESSALNQNARTIVNLDKSYTTDEVLLVVTSTYGKTDGNSEDPSYQVSCADFRLISVNVDSLDRTDWEVKAYVTDDWRESQFYYEGYEDGRVTNMIDGNNNTYWHSNYWDQTGNYGDFSIIVDLNKVESLNQLYWRGRGANANGAATKVAIYTLNDLDATEEELKADVWGSPVYVNNNLDNSSTFVADFATVEATHVKVRIYGSGGDGNHGSCCELMMYNRNAEKTNNNLMMADGVTLSCAGYIERDNLNVINDGKLDGYSAYRGDQTENVYSKETNYVQVDLGKNCYIDSMNLVFYYWATDRVYNNVVIVGSNTADFANPVILYNADQENFFGFGEGSDESVVATSDGIDIDTSASARYLRVYTKGNTNNSSVHIVEFSVYGEAISTLGNSVETTSENAPAGMLVEGYYDANGQLVNKENATVVKSFDASGLDVKYQVQTNGDNAVDARFVATVPSLNPDKAGFLVTLTDGETTRTIDCVTTTVYNSIVSKEGNTKYFNNPQWTYNSCAANYFFALAITDIPTTNEAASITIQAYWLPYSVEDKAENYQLGAARTVTVADLVAGLN